MVDDGDEDEPQPMPGQATPSSHLRFGGEMNPITIGHMDDAQLAAFLKVLGSRGRDGVPEGMAEIVKNARANGGTYVPKKDEEGTYVPKKDEEG